MDNICKKMVLGPVQTNCYIFIDPDLKEAVVFDPGDRGDRIFAYIKEEGAVLKAIILTHGHFDHITGAPELMRLSKDEGWDTVILASEDERELLSDPILNCSGSGMGYGEDGVSIKADTELKDREVIEYAGLKIECIKTPGHTEGSMSFYIPDKRILISGDTVFAGSVGRTDFPTGSMSELMRSIRERIVVLPEFTYILPGHGEETTVRDEKMYNPWFEAL